MARSSSKQNIPPTSTLIVGVDIGSKVNVGYCTSFDGREVKPFNFNHTRQGYQLFWSKVTQAQKRFHCTEIWVGMESTGIYG